MPFDKLRDRLSVVGYRLSEFVGETAASYKASLKLRISDSVVEVSLEGTIRLKEAELPRLMGVSEHLAAREKNSSCEKKSRFEKEFHFAKRSPPFEKNLTASISWRIVYNFSIFSSLRSFFEATSKISNLG